MEVVWLADGDVEPDAPKGQGFLSRDDPIERHLARV
jgi:hypothetical protein